MKPYETYQHLDGEMTPRNVTEQNSKFWGEGKWDNFVLPLLPNDCSELSLIDVGCNSGLFCKLAEEKGFKKVTGIDNNVDAITKGKEYCNKNGYKYELRCENIQDYLKSAPVVDYTILVNAHYYFPIPDWFEYVDKLKSKTRYCLIVTTKKRIKTHLASADIHYLDKYFYDWEKLDGIDPLPTEGDPSPRLLWTRLYKSPILERVKFEGLTNRNDQKGFYEELDNGVSAMNTVYAKYMMRYRKEQWSDEETKEYIIGKEYLYQNIKRNGILEPMILNRKNKVVDGSHRYIIAEHLGETSGIFRRTW